MNIPAPSPRARELADLVVRYSLRLGNTDNLMIQTDKEFSPYVPFFIEAAAAVGAKATVFLIDYNEVRNIIKRGDRREFQVQHDLRFSYLNSTTARVRFDPFSDPNYLVGVDENNQQLFEEMVNGPYSREICAREEKGRYKWNVLAIPCVADAKKAEMSYEDYERFVYASTVDVDWDTLGKSMLPLKAAMDGAKDVHILVPGMTDFHLSLEGRGGDICAGKWNMPDGEFYFGPVEDSANGHITFPYRSTRNGQPFANMKLFYKNGRAVIDKCTAEIGQKQLHAILNSEGADGVGELGIGCNPGITVPMDNDLWDEKIAGTIHIAIGESYDQPLGRGGGLNRSAYHWDIVCDLRKVAGMPGGEIRVDGKTIQRDGLWLI